MTHPRSVMYAPESQDSQSTIARLLVAMVALLVVAACSGSPHADSAAGTSVDLPPLSEVETLTDPKAYAGESTAHLSNTVIEPVTRDPVQQLPTSVTSHELTGQIQLDITDTSRVIGLDLAGSINATIWGLGFGETLVGRDQSTIFDGVDELPVVTSGGHTINSEAVIALNPTLVITDGSIGPRDVVEQLRDVGITVVFVDNDPSFDGASDLARQVAGIYAAPEAGELLAQRITNDVTQVREQIQAIAPSAVDDQLRMIFLYLRGTSGVYYLFGDESGADDLITALGGRDVAAELGWRGMQPMTDEALVAADPDLILVMTGGIESVGGVDGLLAEKPAVALTTAGENRRFVDMADGQILSFGPRSAEVLEALARAIYAPEATQAAAN